jgi:hypothetical protein
VDEPKCGDCHKERRPDFEFEQADTLFRNSKGHHGVNCISCHGSPHAIEPTVVEADNRQAVAVQGSEGVIKKCSVCHGMWRPEFMFDHKFSKAG